MSTNADIALVAQAVLQRHTYYFANRAGITLDGTDYDNSMLSVSDGAYEGNFGEGFAIGSISVVIANGELFIDNKYKYQVTDIWNNKYFTIKRWESGDTAWADCEYYYKGLIKDFDYNFGKISLSVDNKDSRDDILLPSIVCEDNSDIEDAYAESVFYRDSGGDESYIYASNTNIFTVGELVKLTAPNGNSEYQKIKSFFSTRIVMCEDLLHWSDYSIQTINKIEKAFRNLPEAFIGKTIPIQIGDLSDFANGEFGKTITVNEQIGNQSIVADCITLNDLDSIGAWEKGSKRYFEGKATDEYGISSDYKNILFKIDTTTTISYDVNSMAEIDRIDVTDYTKLYWVDEDSADDETNYPELMGTNIIAIDSELMMIIAKPSSSIIYVERGLGGTKITTHSAGAKIYQSSKFSSKNLLSFTERFDVVATSNPYHATGCYSQDEKEIGVEDPLQYKLPTYNKTWGSGSLVEGIIYDGKYNDINSSHIKWFFEGKIPLTAIRQWVNFDIKFDKIDEDFKVYNMIMAIKFDYYIYIQTTTTNNYFTIGLYSSSTVENRAYPVKGWDLIDRDRTTLAKIYEKVDFTGTETDSKDSFTTIDRTAYNGGNEFNPDIFTDGLAITSLLDLNKKWKFTWGVYINRDVVQVDFNEWLKLYNLGLWLDFFLNFTKQTVVSPLKGREITSDVTVVNNDTSPSRVGDLCENPVDVLALLLLQELGYETTDFDSNWETVWSEYDTLSSVCAFSYGVDDDRKEGWKFCEWLASHFNLAITKLNDGTIDIINLYEIYNDTPAGDEILIEDDVIFLEEPSEKLIVIKQTGTDLIYNDIIVKYARNNSTGEYQKEYHLPETYILENDMVPPINLLDARNRYYNGKKRTKIIESPFIYNEDDARRKAEWEANNHACVNLWVEVGIDYNNTDRIGDIKYFTGNHNGIVLSSDNKFFIQNIYPADEGRELALHCKSIQGVDVIVDPDDDNVILDTGGTSLTGDDIWNDTGGTSLSGDDIINDTGAGSSV